MKFVVELDIGNDTIPDNCKVIGAYLADFGGSLQQFGDQKITNVRDGVVCELRNEDSTIAYLRAHVADEPFDRTCKTDAPTHELPCGVYQP